MTRILQFFGWAFFLLGILMAGLLGIMAVGGPSPTEPAGAVWNQLHSLSLGLFQVLVQRVLHMPDFWDDYLVPVLTKPAWQPMSVIIAVSFLLGTLFLYSARRRRRAGIIHRSKRPAQHS